MVYQHMARERFVIWDSFVHEPYSFCTPFPHTQMMEKRHAQFVILWNATCDDPSDYRTKKDLLKALREWEHTQSASGSGSSSSIATGASSASSLHGHKLTVAQDGKYLRQHRSEFADLIAMARPRKVAAEAQVEPPEATVDIDATISATDTSDRASTPAFVQPLSLPDTSTTECCASPIINIALCPKPASKVHQPQPAMASDRDENSGSDVNPIGATTSSAAIPVETATDGRGDDVDGGGCDVDMDDWKLYYPDSDLAFDVSAPAEPPV